MIYTDFYDLKNKIDEVIEAAEEAKNYAEDLEELEEENNDLKDKVDDLEEENKQLKEDLKESTLNEQRNILAGLILRLTDIELIYKIQDFIDENRKFVELTISQE